MILLKTLHKLAITCKMLGSVLSVVVIVSLCAVFRKIQDEWHVDNSVVSADSEQLPVEVVG